MLHDDDVIAYLREQSEIDADGEILEENLSTWFKQNRQNHFPPSKVDRKTDEDTIGNQSWDLTEEIPVIQQVIAHEQDVIRQVSTHEQDVPDCIEEAIDLAEEIFKFVDANTQYPPEGEVERKTRILSTRVHTRELIRKVVRFVQLVRDAQIISDGTEKAQLSSFLL
jgi:vacuolar-type H+-ATPase subunit I/STV1